MIPEKQPMPGVEDLLTELRRFCFPWRAQIIAIDGRDGAGKSTLAHHLAWQLGMPVLSTDLWLSEESLVTHRISEIKNLIMSRYDRGEPTIIEGIMMLQTLELIDIKPEYFILVTNKTRELIYNDDDYDSDEDNISLPYFSGQVNSYLKSRQPVQQADFHLIWQEPL